MKKNISLFLLSFLFGICVISCSKKDNGTTPEKKNTSPKSVSFNINGLDKSKGQKEIFVWLFKNKSFYDTLTLDSNTIVKGNIKKTLPVGNYQLYAVSKNGKIKILAQTSYQVESGGVPPSYNIFIPLTSNGVNIDSSKLIPQVNFKVLHGSSRSHTDEAFNDYFICNEINFAVTDDAQNVNIPFERLGGELTIKINGAEKYPSASIYFSIDTYASIYDFNTKSAIPFVGSRFEGNDWAGMFRVLNGQSTIIQNITNSIPFRLFFRTKKNASNDAYYLQYIDDLSARINLNKRTIVEINFDDLINHINKPKITSSDQWIDLTQSPDNTNL